MNKYTLQFTNPALESSYQKEFRGIYFQFIVLICIGSGLIVLTRMLADYLYGIESRLDIGFAAVGFIIVEIIAINKWRGLIRFGMYVNIAIIMLFQLTLRSNERQVALLFGQNEMGILCFTLFSLEFKDSMFLNLGTFVFRIASANILARLDPIDFAQHIYSVVVYLFLCFCIYYKNLFMRRFYLFSLKDNIYELLYPQMIDKPIFIFSYDSEQLKFIIRKQVLRGFVEQVGNPLIHLIRNAQLNGSSLENFIFRQCQNQSKLTDNYQIHSLYVQYEKKDIKITLSQFNLETQMFILIVDSQSQQLIKLKQINEEDRAQMKAKIILHIQNTEKILNFSIMTNNFQTLFHLRIKYLELIMIIKGAIFKQESIDLVRFFSKIKKQIKNVKGIIMKSQYQNIQVTTSKQHLMIFLMELFSQGVSTNSKMMVTLTVHSNRPVIIVDGLNTLPSSNVFCQASKLLFDQHTINNQKNHIYSFGLEPTVSFLSSGLV